MKQRHLLFINTLSPDKSRLAIVCAEGAVDEVFPAGRGRSETIQSSLFVLLRRAGVSLKQIYCVIVAVGEGSFTGQRTGLAVARALGFSLGIPSVRIVTEKIPRDLTELLSIMSSHKNEAKPRYGGPPHITFPKVIKKIAKIKRKLQKIV